MLVSYRKVVYERVVLSTSKTKECSLARPAGTKLILRGGGGEGGLRAKRSEMGIIKKFFETTPLSTLVYKLHFSSDE